MKVRVTIECMNCNNADATVIAVPYMADDDPKYHWKLCADCAEEKTKYGPCWRTIGKLTPAIREL